MDISLELWLYNGNGTLIAIFVLVLFKADGTTDKFGGKQGMVYSGGAWYLKITLILLTKVGVVYMRLFLIRFWELNL